MSISNLHESVLVDYRNVVRCFFTIADERAPVFVAHALFDEKEWVPKPLLQQKHRLS